MSRVKGIVALLLLAFVVAALSIAATLARSNLGPGGEFDVAGLDERLDIRFDERLRPYADAASLHDALFAEGWLHARYRIWQMELLRRAGNGRLAEALGASMLETDKSLWRAGVPHLAERLEQQASAELLELVDAYVDGVNAGLETYGARPPELILADIDFAEWRRRDVFAVGAIIAFQSANNMDNELLRLSLANALDPQHAGVFFPDEARSPGFPYVLESAAAIAGLGDPLDAFRQRLLPNASLGSSGWAVAPSRSASGNALFAFDSHDALNLPNLFYEVHLFYDSGRSIRGWSLPGLPGVINGFNERLAWGMTNIGDTQDLYLETRHGGGTNRFVFDGVPYEARTETVEIPVKGREPEELLITHTANGPLISEEPPIALRWTGHDLAGRGMEGLLAMNTARNWSEFEAALNRHAAPSANITYADMDGRIAFRTIGLLPRRASGRGLAPLDGSNSGNAWQGYVPDAELPRSTDPLRSYVAAANARVHAGEPLVSADNAPGYRMRRLHDVLGSRDDFELADMQALQLDARNEQAARLLPYMLDDLGEPPGELQRRALGILRDWMADPRNGADSAGALLWEHWYPELAKTVFGAALEDDLLRRVLANNYVTNHALDRLVAEEPDSPWWQGRRGQLLAETFAATVDRVAAEAGDDPSSWRWDSVHSVSFRHELHGAVPLLDKWLSRGPYAWGGGHPVLARARYRYATSFEGRAGATVRVVAEMGAHMTVRAIMPGGQHGHPASRHYDDQLPAWLSGDLQDISERPQRAGATTTLVPAGGP